jgi:putative DNA primase/helicase
LFGEIPGTITQETGRADGGLQLLFKDNGHDLQNSAEDGIDLRSTGGIVVLPPSLHKTGKKYRWKNIDPVEDGLDDLLEMPAELSQFFKKRNGRIKDKKPLTFEPVPEGSRNDTLTRLIGKWVYQGMDLETAYLAGAGWNGTLAKPLEDQEVTTIVESVFKTDGRNHPAVADGIQSGILDFQTVLSLELPEKRVFLDPWITEQSITLISGWRGTGKTWLALSILNAISKGVKFGPWQTETPVPCLYLDGEMTINDMQYRAKQLEMDQGRKEPFFLYSDAYATNLGLSRANLLDEKWRTEMKAYLLDNNIKLWVGDNIASLSPGMNENAKDEWDPVNEFLLRLRFAGIASILLHHTGKAGSQRGTSAREDNIDTSIILKHPGDYEIEDGCRFTMEFTKNRVVGGDHFLLADQELQYQGGLWSFGDAKVNNSQKILDMLGKGFNQTDIANELGVTRQFVSKVKLGNE